MAGIINLDDDDNTPAAAVAPVSKAPARATASPSSKRAPQQINKSVRNAALIIGGLVAIGLVVWSMRYMANTMYYQPKQKLAENSHLVHYRFERDAFSDEIRLVDTRHQAKPEEIFDSANLDKYLAGQGFDVEWVIRNDPRTKYATSVSECGELKVRGEAEMTPKRRLEVAEAQGQFQECVEKFKTELPLTRSIKIGIDDTNGIDQKWRDLVTRKMASVRATLPSKKDTVKLTVFRITGTTFTDLDDAMIAPNMSMDEVDRIWSEKLDWLLAERKSAKESSIAVGLFNILSQDQDIRLNQVYLFSDGIENSPQQTTDFYPLLRSPHGWEPEKLDAAIKKGVEQFPDLSYTSVTWYFPPVTWLVPPVPEAGYKTVQKYWRHILVDLCHSKNVALVY